MTAKTEVVKACFRADTDIRPATAVTTDARPLTAAIDVVVMTLNAAHRTMLVVRKVQDQTVTALKERLPQSQGRAARQQCKQCDH